MFEVDDVFTFIIIQGAKDTLRVISDDGTQRQYSTIIDVSKNDGSNQIVKVKFQFIADFFYSQSTTDPLHVTGLVKLGLKSLAFQVSTGAVVSVPRKAQEEISGFSLDVDLTKERTSDAWKYNAHVLYSTTFSGAFYTR